MLNIEISKFKQGEYLSSDIFFQHFDKEWDKLSNSFLKYEALQYYNEGENSPFDDFIKGDQDQFIKKLISLHKVEKPFYESAKSRGASFARLHAINLPISDYLKFEFNSYFLSKKLGENIYVIEEKNVKNNLGFLIPDFMIFDESSAFIQDYYNGQLKGAWLITEAELIKNLISVFKKLLNYAIPFENIYHGLPKLVELIKNNDRIFE